MNLFQSARIKFAPLKYSNAITDLSDNTIYLSTSVDPLKINDILMDEYAHIISGSGHHKDKWSKTCNILYGRIPDHNKEIDKWKDKYGKMSGCCNFSSNIGNISGYSNLLLDYHLLQSYRKFSQRILGTEGSWEIINENNPLTGKNEHRILLKPTPKGSFPVVVRYLPSVDNFNLPQCRELASRMMIAEAKIIIGHTRRKLGVPGPDGGSIALDGDALVSAGQEEKNNIVQTALNWGEPMGFYLG